MSALRKLRRDMHNWPPASLENPHPIFSKPPYPDKIVCRLELLITGPDNTLYANHQFNLELLIDEDYPFRAPKIKFLTPILHPGVVGSGPEIGKICDKALEWSPAMNLHQYVHQIQNMLAQLDAPSPVNDSLVKLLAEEPHIANSEISTWVKRYARPLTRMTPTA